MRAKLKSSLINVAKVSVAVGLVIWMVRTDRLDFSQLKILITHPWFLVFSIAVWAVAAVLFGSFRWWMLLKGIGLDAPYFRTVQLHLIGLFFNATMPGAVGGDIIKAVYIMRDHDSETKTPAMLTILLDRVVGLMGLFLLGFIVVVAGFNQVWSIVALRPMIMTIFGVFVFTLFFFAVIFFPIKKEKDPIWKFVQLKLFGFGILKKIYVAFISYRDRPYSLVAALFLSMIIQTIFMFYFIAITQLLNNAPVDVLKFASIFPIGVLATAIPLAPGGLGVGHVAFEELYKFIGLANGANTFNVYLLVMITMSLTGVVPYLFLKKKIEKRGGA